MGRTRTQIISASRRTDVPGWYATWFSDCIQRGRFSVKNPYNRTVKTIEISPENTHCIVFWSKNYGPFLDQGIHLKLIDMGYRLFFNFTLNSRSKILEPGLPPLENRLAQAQRLSRRFGPETIAWRFDPVCFYQQGSGNPMNNLADFPEIADKMGELGVKKCVVSFYDPYKKVEKRTAHLALKGREPIRFMDPGPEKKLEVLRRMARLLAPLGITLGLCCESQLLLRIREIPDHTPAGKELKCIESNACIDGHYLKALYGGTPTLARDFGQRAQKGCQCTRSVDIGSYEDHPCFHDCLFCYANTGLDTRIKTELKK